MGTKATGQGRTHPPAARAAAAPAPGVPPAHAGPPRSPAPPPRAPPPALARITTSHGRQGRALLCLRRARTQRAATPCHTRPASSLAHLATRIEHATPQHAPRQDTEATPHPHSPHAPNHPKQPRTSASMRLATSSCTSFSASSSLSLRSTNTAHSTALRHTYTYIHVGVRSSPFGGSRHCCCAHLADGA